MSAARAGSSSPRGAKASDTAERAERGRACLRPIGIKTSTTYDWQTTVASLLYGTCRILHEYADQSLMKCDRY
eukprot:1737172-Pleurochrysis_carterae.AAC.2